MLSLLLSAALMGDGGPARPTTTSDSTGLHTQRFVGNRLGMFVSNRGMIARNPVTGNSGLEYPRGSGKHLVYTAGLWLGGYVGSDLRLTMAEYAYDFRGGPYGAADEANWPVLRLTRAAVTLLTDASTDNDGLVSAAERADFDRWLRYPGAPRKFDSTRGGPYFGRPVPRLSGDEMLYSVYHDGGPGSLTPQQHLVSTRALDVEVRQTVFGIGRPGALERTVFVRYQIFNRGSQPIDSVRLGLWMDPDLGGAADDLVGFDVPRSLAYGYNGDESDSEYGKNVPAAGWALLQGPLVPGAANEHGDAFGQTRSGVRNVPATAGFYTSNGGLFIWEPSAEASYLNLRGYTRSGAPFSFEFPNSRFMAFGDPVTGTPPLDGVLDQPGDRRMLMGVGPFQLGIGDSQEVITALAVGDRLGNRIANITDLRAIIDTAQIAARTGFPEADLTRITVESPPAPMRFRLFPSTPNPFNPTTTLRYVLPVEGPVQLIVYDLLGRRVRTLVDGRQAAGEYVMPFDGSGLASGVYLVQLVAREFSQTQRLTLLR